jgi:V8-like Glu-specific endopeptidase
MRNLRLRQVVAWIAAPWIGMAPLAGCGQGPGGSEPTGTTASAIYGGVEDDDAEQNGAVVALEIGSDTSFTLCSGSLIAPNVVLTARHCVSTLTAAAMADVSCADDGGSTNGADFGADQPLDSIRVYAGPSIYQGETPSATASALYHPTGTTLCNGDIALVVLTTSITGVTPLAVRVAAPVTVGESVRVVGFGENDDDVSIGVRFRKDDLAVLAVGPTVSASSTALGSSELELGESICEGDSGGPALDETTGAVVGVASRGGTDCTQSYGHVFTSLEAFVPLFQQAFAAAGGSWTAEGSKPTGAPEAGVGTDPGSGAEAGSTGSSSGGAEGVHYGDGVNLRSGAGPGCAMGDTRVPLPWSVLAVAVACVLAIGRRRVRPVRPL